MHIPDGFVSLPVNLIDAGISLSFLTYSMKKISKYENSKQKIPLVSVFAAFIFAAQMLNFPVAGGTSGHLLGGFLASLIVGPWYSFLLMSIVLILQCFSFADGGVIALGSNIFNMALIGGVFTYYIYLTVKKLLKIKDFNVVSVAFFSWFSVVLSAFFCSLELVLSGTSKASVVFPAMLSIHALIGIGEAIITVSVVGVFYKFLPKSFVNLKNEI